MTWLLIGLFITVGCLLALRGFVAEEKAVELLRAGAVVVDVRTRGEFQCGHIDGALHIPLGTGPGTIRQLLPDPNRAVLVHCLGGGRSNLTKQQLRAMGYGQVHNLGSLERARQIVRAAKEVGRA